MMRADRLLAELLILQARPGTTAAALAEELEVSVRTVYRDMQALGAAGVPVTSLSGPGGGYSLYGDWRSDLSGLTAEELASLSLAVATGTAAGDPARRAVLKLASALPDSLRDAVASARRHIYIDPAGVSGGEGRVGMPARLAGALRRGAMVDLTLRGPRATLIRAAGRLLGLVSSGGAWHLVWRPAGGAPRVHRVDDVLDVRAGPGAPPGPGDFDLASFWREWRARREAERTGLRAVLRVSPPLLGLLEREDREPAVERVDGPGVVVAMVFESMERARADILAWGGAAEVLYPEALRRTVADFASQAAARYQP